MRVALGYDQIALRRPPTARAFELYLRRHPQTPAAVILDGVLPPDHAASGPTPRWTASAPSSSSSPAAPRSRAAPRPFRDLGPKFAALLARFGHAHPPPVTLAGPADRHAARRDFDRGCSPRRCAPELYIAGEAALMPV